MQHWRPMSLDPLDWFLPAAGQVHREAVIVKEVIIAWDDLNDQPGFERDFDPRQRITAALTIRGRSLKNLAPVDQTTVAANFERGMWTEWLHLHGHEARLTGAPGPIVYYEHEFLGDIVKQRCLELGVSVQPYVESLKQLNAPLRIGAKRPSENI